MQDESFYLAAALKNVFLMNAIISSRSILLILLYLSIYSLGHSQITTLGSQADIDAFDPSTYSINGHLLIGDFNNDTDINNLSPLDGLSEIKGFLTIRNTKLVDLTGLSNLSYVEGLSIKQNDELLSTQGLNSLTQINGDFNFYQNRKLINVDGFQYLNSIDGNVVIGSNNPNGTNLDGLSELKTINGYLSVSNTESIYNLDGLRGLNTVGGYLSIRENKELENINGLSGLSSLGGYLVITNNDKLVHLDGFTGLTHIKDDLSISNCETLNNLQGLSNINEINGELDIYNNDALVDLDGLQLIKRVDGDLRITLNYNLSNCCAIQKLVKNQSMSIGGNINISSNLSECLNEDAVINDDCSMRLITSTSPTCINGATGKINVYVIDYGSSSFQYQWSSQNGELNDSGEISGNELCIDMLNSGVYNVTITNSELDTAMASILVPLVDGRLFEIIELVSTNSSNGLSNGSIRLRTQGGTAPYTAIWEGSSSGTLNNISTEEFVIHGLTHGNYNISIIDSDGIEAEVTASLLDEEVQVIECEEPLDIVILNDVSGSVDLTEYNESKSFFLNLLEAVNIGEQEGDSRAAIIEWSDADEQDIKVHLTGDINQLNEYINLERSFSSYTSPHEAMTFAEEYINQVGRPNSEKVIVLSTDGSSGQISSSLIALADELKSKGFHIITIAFDKAYSDETTRNILKEIASVDELAPGAQAYSLLSEELADNIANKFLCPVDPGSSATAYFNIDGAIEIIDYELDGNCPYPENIEITFRVSAQRELSLPAGTPVTFYFNNPEQLGATPILTWQTPCVIPVGESEEYTISIPVSNPSHIFAILNDDGQQTPPINFPVTNIIELAYYNNDDNIRICLDGQATIQASKSADLNIPICDTLVNYTINVCNVSEIDAYNVGVEDIEPMGFILKEEVFNNNNCAVKEGNTYNIPAGCCFSLHLTYDASAAALGSYTNQDVIVFGPNNQTYIPYDGNSSIDEDVVLDGNIDCPSTIIEFTKSVNKNSSCDDVFVEFTFTINNTTNIPLKGIEFNDILPTPCTWVHTPYSINGLTISGTNFNANEATITISEVQANTLATFKLDANLNTWESDGILTNSATLDNVPDLVNGGLISLNSNSTTTAIQAAPQINLPDTIIVNSIEDSIIINSNVTGDASLTWSSDGDGFYSNLHSEQTTYYIGNQDSLNNKVTLFLAASSDCHESGHALTLIIQDCEITAEILDIYDCNNMGTPFDDSDDTYDVSFEVNGTAMGPDSLFIISYADILDTLAYQNNHVITLDADNIIDSIHIQDFNRLGCSTSIALNQESCAIDCAITLDHQIIHNCNNNNTPQDSTDDTYIVEFIVLSNNDTGQFQASYNSSNTASYNYGDTVSISLIADNIVDSILVYDIGIDSCSLWISTNEPHCYEAPPCELTIQNISTADCNDNGTPQDSTDDFYLIDVVIDGEHSASTYNAYNNGIDLGSFQYNTTTSFSLPADNILDSILIVDSINDSCFVWLTSNQNHCYQEPLCEIEIVSSTIFDCDDNGTPQDSTDDFYMLDFIIDGEYSSNTFNAYYNGATLGTYNYEVLGSISLPADNVLDSILIVDSINDSCYVWLTGNQNHCYQEPLCELEIVSSIIFDCDDNGTPQDSTDDLYEIELIINNSLNDSAQSFNTVYDNEINGPFDYNEAIVFTLSADNIQDSILIMDNANNSCQIYSISNQNSCSQIESCEIRWPKVFFPNGKELKNQTFGPINQCDQLLENYSLRIYNRWGEEVFSSYNQTNEWDGTYNDQNGSTAVYVWVAMYQLNGLEKIEKGSITLIR